MRRIVPIIQLWKLLHPRSSPTRMTPSKYIEQHDAIHLIFLFIIEVSVHSDEWEAWKQAALPQPRFN